MKRLLSLVLVCLFAGVLCAQEKNPTATRYTVADLKIEVTFPGNPTDKNAAGGRQVMLPALGDKAIYFFQYSKFPKEFDVLNDPVLAKKILDGGRDGALKSLKNSKLLSEKDFSFQNKYPARTIEVEAPMLGIYRTHMILTPNYLYMVMVGGTKEFITSESSKKFMGSFKIKE